MDANVSELMAPEKRKTLQFGPLQVTQSLIDFYVSKSYFKKGECRHPSDEVTPVLKDDEVVVFKDFFVAGMPFPLDPVLPSVLLPFNAKLHHLTHAFCRLYELHSQGHKVFFEGDDEPYEAQSGCCIFVPRCNNKKAGLKRIELSHAQKNKWEDDWTQY